MRNGFLIPTCILLAGCMDSGAVDPDTIGIGPVPDAPESVVSIPANTIQTDKTDLNCLLQEVQIALSQAPAQGKVPFAGLQVCKIAPGS